MSRALRTEPADDASSMSALGGQGGAQLRLGLLEEALGPAQQVAELILQRLVRV
jgi:hypothetical protein